MADAAVREQLSNLIVNYDRTIETIEQGYEYTTEAAYDLACAIGSVTNTDKSDEETADRSRRLLEELKTAVVDYVRQREMLKREKAQLELYRQQLTTGQLNLIAAQNDNGSSVLDLRGMFREFLDKLPVVNSRLIKRETQDFYRRLWQYEHPANEMPAADEMDAAYSGDNNNNDNDDDGMEEDDVQVAFERESFICPLSQSELVNPVTSSVCKHTFSRDPINQYLRQQNHNPVCPVPGCNRRLQTADLKPNKAIERRVARLQFTQINADDQDDYVVVSK